VYNTKTDNQQLKQMNYFEFYKLPISFTLDLAALRKQFLTFSKAYHPDFHTSESEEKQAEILELSTVNNEAYKTLKDSDKRMKYILELKNLLGGQIKTSLPQSFLLEMMDINEQVMELQFDYNPDAYKAIETEVKEKEVVLLDSTQGILDQYNDATATTEQLEKIRDYYLENRYLLRLKENMRKLIV
jgi:molecular chaperone HscB